MDAKRSVLLLIFAVTSYLLFVNWQQTYHGAAKKVNSPEQSTVLPEASVEPGAAVPETTEAPQGQSPSSENTLLTVETDVLRLKIDTRGGDVVEAALLKYPERLNEKDNPVRILTRNGGHHYVAQAGVVGLASPDGKQKALFTAPQKYFRLASDQSVLVVPLSWTNEQGVRFTKTYRLQRGSYQITLDYQIENKSNTIQKAQLFTQLVRDTEHAPEDSQGLGMRAYLGAAFSTEDKRYEKYNFDDIREKPLKLATHGGWVAILQHYFLSAWVPRSEGVNRIYTLTPDRYIAIGIMQPMVQIKPGTQAQFKADLYVGPKIQETLAEIAPGLDLTVDYGVLWWIGQPLFWLMKAFYSLVGNWGVAIILVTIVVKLLLFPLSNAQYRSFAKMRKLQPKLQALKERYGDDRQKMSQAMMELYRKEKVNPLGGCLPLLLQMPVFFALYWVLLESVELRHAPFFAWIQDLSAQDPYYVLPLLMGVSMWVMQKMQPTAPNMDPMQQKIMQFMPVMMTVFFLFFPSGLVLYWLVNNTLSIIQQVVITRMMEKDELRKSA